MCLHMSAQSGQSQASLISPGFGNSPLSRSVTIAMTLSEKRPCSSSSIEPIWPAHCLRTRFHLLAASGAMRISMWYSSEPLTMASTLPFLIAR